MGALRRGRVGDHRGEIGLGRQLAVNFGAASEFGDAATVLHHFHLQVQQAAGLHGRAELGFSIAMK